ncbi:MAG: MBL fold metallo-hydrolase [Chloroflexota bacterium]
MSSLEVWWLGQAGFRLRDPSTGVAVFIDPFLSPVAGRTWPAPLTPEQMGTQAQIILCTHEHIDHFDQPALKAAAAVPGAAFTLIVPVPIVDVAVQLGIPRERVIGVQPDDAVAVQDVVVHAVLARHGINVSDAYTFGTELPPGLARYLGYVVALGGVRTYHAGDCIPYAGQAGRVRALQPELALLPINGRDFYRESEHNLVGNMDVREAARLAVDLDVQLMIPMHWEMFAGNRGFPGELVTHAAEFHPQLNVLTLGRGGRFLAQFPDTRTESR